MKDEKQTTEISPTEKPLWTGPTSKEVSRSLTRILNQTQAGEDRTSKFIELTLDSSAPFVGDKLDILKTELSALEGQSFENDEALVSAAGKIVADFMNKYVSPRELELQARKEFLEKGGFTPLNEILSYGHDGKMIHFHLAPARTETEEHRDELIKDGLEKLATAMVSNPELKDIQEIKLTSWLVANPKWQKKIKDAGFAIGGSVSDEIRNRYFSGSTGEIREATMNRADFLARYLKSNL